MSRFRAQAFLQTSSHRISTHIKSLSSSKSSLSQLHDEKRSASDSNGTTESGVEAMEMASKKRKAVVHPSAISQCHLEVFNTSNCELSSPSLYLFTDHKRYVFNCGENFLRFVSEHRNKVLKVPTFFFTRVTWRNLGGFVGTCMTYRSYGHIHLNVYGPGKITQFTELVRYFVGRKFMMLTTNWESDSSVSTGTCPNDVIMTSPSTHVHSDENVTITMVELEPKSVTESESQIRKAKKVDKTSSLDDREEIIAPERKRMKYNEDHTPLPTSTCTAAYICKVADSMGRFNPDRAKELGLEKGFMYKKLVAGESVTAPDGRLVHPSDVIGETRIGPTFIVIECPSKEYISAVTSHPKLQKEYFSDLGQEMVLVVHFSPLEVLQDDDYCQWAASFGESTQHLLLNKSVCPLEIDLRTSMDIQYPLYLMNPNVHHPPVFKNSNPECCIDLKLSRHFPDPKKAIILGRPLLKFRLKPVQKMGEDHSNVLAPIEDEITKHFVGIQSNDKLASAIAAGRAISVPESTIALKPTEESIKEYSKGEDLVRQTSSPGERQNVSDLANTPPNITNGIILDAKAKPEEESPVNQVDRRLFELFADPQPLTPHFHGPDDAVVTFLGTASTGSSPYRNVSGILVHTPNSGNFILDCGEGSLSQIYRCFPREVADEIILNLKAIFISHVHGDHHLGLVGILQKREELIAAKKRAEEHLMAPSATSYHDDVAVIATVGVLKWIHTYRKEIEKVSCKLISSHIFTKDFTERDDSIGVVDFHLETVPVIHCKHAFGVVVRHASGWSIVYSGDTRPCPELIQAGRGASLLIHEATLRDVSLNLAVRKKHCTVSEALEVSDKMKPEFTILTHFSQRNPITPPPLMTSQLLSSSRVAVAFDCMSVNLKQLDQLHSYLPVIRDILTGVIGVENDYKAP